MYQHDENAEARSQTRVLTTLRLSTYSHSHYSDEPNKEMHTVLFTPLYVRQSEEQTQEQTKLTHDYA